jgi:hypothetical protein
MRSVACLVFLIGFGLTAASKDQLTHLPNITLKETGPRTYEFVCEYFHLDPKGNLREKERISGLYTRGLPEGQVRWSAVRAARAQQMTDPFPGGDSQPFMEGLTYRPDGKRLFAPEFFSTFPEMAVKEKNLIWDVFMFESFGRDYFDKLRLNEPYTVAPSTAPLAGTGSFENKDMRLTWAGISRRNGEDCALIEYSVYFNRFELKLTGIEMLGRSHYWGTIWVSLQTKQIEHGTLDEDVLGEMKTAAQTTPQVFNVFRRAVFRPIQNKTSSRAESAVPD